MVVERDILDTLYVVVPCYNEEQVLPETAQRLAQKLRALITQNIIAPGSRVVFVDDGSSDATWAYINQLHEQDALFCGVNLARNVGHQYALLAGLLTAKEYADVVISMDADLQDDINAIDAMLEKYAAGCDVVYGVRSARNYDTAFKRNSAWGFYALMRFLGVNIVNDHADFRLMSRRACEALAQFDEVNIFLRGIVPLLGFKTDVVMYERTPRFAGETKYPFKKMCAFAIEGITSLSVTPIRYVTLIGIIVFLMSLCMLAYCTFRWAAGATVIGWASVICSVWGIGGLILLALGIIGEYIGKMYLETKGRPRYIIKESLLDNKTQ